VEEGGEEEEEEGGEEVEEEEEEVGDQLSPFLNCFLEGEGEGEEEREVVGRVVGVGLEKDGNGGSDRFLVKLAYSLISKGDDREGRN
jgi:hypothetical protein